MVDLNTFIFNSCKITDIADTAQSQTKSAELPFQKDNTDDDLLMAQGSFVLLLSELFAQNAPDLDEVTETKELESPTLTSEIQRANNELIIANGQTEPVLEYADQTQEQGTDLSDFSQMGQESATRLDSNVALNWIDYEHFEPPISGSLDDASAEQSLSEMRYISLEQAKEPANFFSSAIDTEQQNDFDNGQFIQNSTSPDAVDFVLPQLNDAYNDKFDAMAKTSELIQSLSDKSIQSASQTLEPDFSAIQSTMGHDQLKQGMSETIKSKMLDIPVPLNDAQWADKFSEHIVWLGHQSVKSAVIKINPEELGPLEISVKVLKEAASVNITSHSGHVRDIVDQALPRLRDMMAEQGLDLAEVTFSSGTSTDSRQSEHQHNGSNNEVMFDVEEGTLITSLKKGPPKGLIDYFA